MNVLMASGDIAVAQGREGPFHETLRHLSRHWERIDVLCPRAPGTADRELHGNVFVHAARASRLLQPRFVVEEGARLAAERRYDLIVSHDYGVFYNGLGAWLLSRRVGVPYVSEILHVEGYPRAASMQEAVYRRLASAYIRWVWRHAVAIRTMNRFEVPGLLRRLGVPEEKILVLPAQYLDHDVFRPLPQEPKRYDALLVGRLAVNKGIPTFLEALARVRRERPGLRACILGEGPLRGEVERRIERLGLREHVMLVARLPSARDVAALYNQARLLVSASTAEGGPRVTIEAMACGVPIVTTPVGTMPELIRDGENGFLFHWDARELASRIALLLGDDHLRARVGEAGRRAVQGLRAEEVIARYAECYRGLARGAART